MSTAPHRPITSGSRGIDPRKMAAGKLGLGCVIRGDIEVPRITDSALEAVLYYVDNIIFLPTGGSKAKKALRAEGKKRGIGPAGPQ